MRLVLISSFRGKQRPGIESASSTLLVSLHLIYCATAPKLNQHMNITLNYYCHHQQETTMPCTATQVKTSVSHSVTRTVLPLSCSQWQFRCQGWCHLRGKHRSSDREYLGLWPRNYSVALSTRYPPRLVTTARPTTVPRRAVNNNK